MLTEIFSVNETRIVNGLNSKIKKWFKVGWQMCKCFLPITVKSSINQNLINDSNSIWLFYTHLFEVTNGTVGRGVTSDTRDPRLISCFLCR